MLIGHTDTYEKGKEKRFNATATGANNSCNKSHDKSNRVTSKVKVCPMCNENHDMEDYTYYLQKTMEERIKFLFKNKLCYGCLKTVAKEHNAKTCLSRISCKVCNEKHATILQGYLRKTTAINSNKGLTHDGKVQKV